MKNKNGELTEEEIQSAKASAALQDFELGRGEMIVEYDRLDDQCIALAEKFRTMQLAGTWRSQDIGADLLAARRARDNVRFVWGRMHDELEARCQKYWLPACRQFCQTVKDFVRWCASKRDINLFGRSGYEQHERVQCANNFQQVNKKIEWALSLQKKVQSMGTWPLAEINDFIEECEAEFRKIQKSKEPFAFVKAAIPPADAKLMQELAYGTKEQSEMVYRKEFTQ